jgi:diaminopimelate decarboxylase
MAAAPAQSQFTAGDLLARRLALFPDTAAIGAEDGALHIGGCDIAALAATHGTPLYLFDAATLDHAVADYRSALAACYPAAAGLTYAGKAFLCKAVAQWAVRRDLWIDCTGVGEIAVAVAAGAPRGQILVHGVNKSADDLAAAVQHAGVIVVDNLAELERLTPLLAGRVTRPALWLRVKPGLAVDTHAYRQTGQVDSKFGMAPEEVVAAVRHCHAAGLPLTGLHFHQGSHFHDPEPIGPALETVLDLMVHLRATTGWTAPTLSPGGGWGVAYHEEDLPQPAVAQYVAFIAAVLVQGCRARNLPLPALHLEPGRSLVARAGVALYRVGAVKQTPGRRWVMIDGGLADNPRPALYGARYSALPVSEVARPAGAPVWVAGPYCESGDVLIEGLPLPALTPGELLAVPVSGAYHLAMQSNYNGARRPAVLWLRDGRAQVIQRRESTAEMMARDADLAE